jgi:endonuclease YncB( thermonuclease family)
VDQAKQVAVDNRMKLSSPLRRRKLLSLCGSLLLASLLISAVGDHLRGAARDDWAAFDHQIFHVTQIISGDTICVTPISSDHEIIVRLIGVEATAMPAAYWAVKAKNYVEARSLEKNVTLRLEPIDTRDRQGRVRAYVYLSDIDCLNADLVHDGEVFADRRYAHSFKPQYEMTENEARKKQRGLWYGLRDEDMPAWRREWLRSFRH